MLEKNQMVTGLKLWSTAVNPNARFIESFEEKSFFPFSKKKFEKRLANAALN